ncbi:MAG: hypothetical protein UT61_C0062G0002 [Candidatus Woesebacteria bacterium GW2011_GWA1_39_8]|uniref:Uncharacterized protein n=1 Tax=Candidatus Woesebacteria bacterium GW2011_GWA1_39_8 TaxID=1618552 RepID=A0A0G0SQK6_9BACT|nr:MAG: hypothetical protein UT61_C0062G0002 [Candidatus Woesebacteria bacterium GW2011_GWA1_39_8]
MDLKIKSLQFLETAKINLEKDLYLVPIVVVNDMHGKGAMIVAQFPKNIDSIGKTMGFRQIAKTLKKKGITPYEAVFIAEGWVAEVKKDENVFKYAPSEHPNRREAITITARNSDNSQNVLIMQFFEKADGKIDFKELKVSGAKDRGEGLLDYLFLPDTISN